MLNPLELFFDVVFVFAFTQITAFLADHLTWLRMLQGAALLAAMWWAWVKYSWLTVTAPVDQVLSERVLVLAATAVTFLLALTIRGAFEATAFLFGTAYLVLNALHIGLSMVESSRDTRRRFRDLLPGFLGGPVLLLAAAFVDHPLRIVLWLAGITVDYSVMALRGVARFRLHSGHFVERYRHIVIIALGETILSMGFSISTSELRLPLQVQLAALVGFVLVATLGWLYFDYVTYASEERITDAEDYERGALARDSYAYLHLPIVAGIIFIALGLDQTVEHVTAPLETLPAIALCGGAALYLLGHTAFRLRDIGSISVARLVTAGAALALIPLAFQVPALMALAVLTALLVGLAIFETAFSPLRREVHES
jgi:low temperature requirement protein LtrA